MWVWTACLEKSHITQNLMNISNELCNRNSYSMNTQQGHLRHSFVWFIKHEDKNMNNCPGLLKRVWVCAFVCSSGCRSTVITSAGGPASPLPTPSPLPPHCSTAMESRCPTLVWGQNWINVQKQMTPSAASRGAAVTGLQSHTAQSWAHCHPTLGRPS